MASTGSCIDFAHREGRAVSESNVRKMNMWTINSRDLLESLCRKRTRYMRSWRDNAESTIMKLPILTDNAEHGKGQEGVRSLREKEIDNVNLGNY